MELVGAAYKQDVARSITALQDRGYNELAGDGQEPAWQRQSQLGPTLSGPTQAPPLPPPDAAAARLAAWVAVLWAGFGFQRGLCAAGLPYDCDSFDAADVFNTLTLLAFLGGALAWLAGVTAPDRFAFLFSWRRAYLGVVYAAILPAYSALGNLPALQASLANTGSWGAGMIAAFALVGLVVLAALAFHLWLAFNTLSNSSSSSNSRSGGSLSPSSSGSLAGDTEAPAAEPSAPFTPPGWTIGTGRGSEGQLIPPGAATALKRSSSSGGGRRVGWRKLGLYLLPRLAILLYFGIWCAVLPASGAFSLHLHHYALGWAAASFAAFNHPVSGLLLAAGTAVFVQGGAVYGFDPLFTRHRTGGCLGVSSNSTGQMTCAFWGAQPFNLSFCSDTPTIPWFDCTVPWPWPETAILGRGGYKG